MVEGSCLCGAVRFAVEPQEVVASVACRCANCMKVSGVGHGVYLQVRPKGFRWLAGRDAVAAYESSPGNDRAFCATCGCVAPVQTGYGAVRVPAGALDSDPGVVPEVLLYAERSAPWCDPEAAGERFADTGPPAYWRKVGARLFGLA